MHIQIGGYYLYVDGIPIAGGYIKDDHHMKAAAEFITLYHQQPGYFYNDHFRPVRYFQWAKYYPVHWHAMGKFIQGIALYNQTRR